MTKCAGGCSAAAPISTGCITASITRAARSPELSVDCRCRKPLPGMIEDAVRDHGIDPTQSWVIGDKWLDVQPGHARRRAIDPGAHRLGRRAGAEASGRPAGRGGVRQSDSRRVGDPSDG